VVEKPRNLLLENKGNLSAVVEGQNYLNVALEYAVGLHQLQNKSRDAIALMQELLELDKNDYAVSRYLWTII